MSLYHWAKGCEALSRRLLGLFRACGRRDRTQRAEALRKRQILDFRKPRCHFCNFIGVDQEVLVRIFKEEFDRALEDIGVRIGKSRIAHDEHAGRTVVVDFDFALGQCAEGNVLGRRSPGSFTTHLVEDVANGLQTIGTLFCNIVAFANDLER